jgi:hypothetical protein
MKYICGPEHDKREIDISLPYVPKNIGVFISGGMDSAVLYYLLLKENISQNNRHFIVPFVIAREEGSKYFAVPVIRHIHRLLNLPKPEIYFLDIEKLEPHRQVVAGIDLAYSIGCEVVYTGAIEQLAIHAIGWDRPQLKETYNFKAPFLSINKSHIISLISQLGLESIFYITYACVQDKGRCNQCNGCNERAWGFRENNLIDPGNL